MEIAAFLINSCFPFDITGFASVPAVFQWRKRETTNRQTSRFHVQVPVTACGIWSVLFA